ncbi:hypothetical protein BC937DRAFT_86936, partial [Endogone sp. FLAS-F59071]
HRDLHWGNVLLRPLNSEGDSGRVEVTLGNGRTAVVPTHGVRACVIDYTLSRMEKKVEGEFWSRSLQFIYLPLHISILFYSCIPHTGDYQFDIYRLMLSETKGDWRGFYPRTNVLVRISPFPLPVCPFHIHLYFKIHPTASLHSGSTTLSTSFSSLSSSASRVHSPPALD